MLDDAFPRETLDWNGKTLRMQAPTLQAKAAVKEELEVEALAGFRRKRHLMDTAEYHEALRALARDFTARVYAWGRPEWARCMQDPDHYKRALWHVLLQQVHPEKASLNPWLTPAMMDQLYEDMSYPADEAAGKPAGNLVDDALGRLQGPDPNRTAPPGTTPAAAAPSTDAS